MATLPDGKLPVALLRDLITSKTALPPEVVVGPGVGEVAQQRNGELAVAQRVDSLHARHQVPRASISVYQRVESAAQSVLSRL